MKTSAGVVLFRRGHQGIEVFLVHPGGPFWATKDDGAWSIPKGEFSSGEDPLEAARREFSEETGCDVQGEFISLNAVKQPSGKLIVAWAVEGDLDAETVRSNRFSMEWPPGSGRQEHFPEVDRAEWFPIDIARTKLLKGQLPFLDRIEDLLSTRAAWSGDR
jgi:predicted NUDIX family NTP pyrophosphohydrolase